MTTQTASIDPHTKTPIQANKLWKSTQSQELKIRHSENLSLGFRAFWLSGASVSHFLAFFENVVFVGGFGGLFLPSEERQRVARFRLARTTTRI
jgi:hypothetical protein